MNTDGRCILVDPRLVRACLAESERGDGRLYAALHRGRFAYDKAAGRWLRRQGAHWVPDLLDQALIGVEEVARAYSAEADRGSRALRGLRARQADAEGRAEACARRGDAAGETAARADAARLFQEVETEESLCDGLRRRAADLRTLRRARRVLFWAHHVETPLVVVSGPNVPRGSGSRVHRAEDSSLDRGHTGEPPTRRSPMEKPLVFRSVDMITVPELAKRLGCSRRHAYRLAQLGPAAGGVLAFRFGGRRNLSVPAQEVGRLKARRSEGGA